MTGAGEAARVAGAGVLKGGAGNPDGGSDVCCGGTAVDGAVGADATCSGASGITAEGAAAVEPVEGGVDGGITITAAVTTTAAVEAMMIIVRNGIGIAVPVLASVKLFGVSLAPMPSPICKIKNRAPARRASNALYAITNKVGSTRGEDIRRARID